MKGNEGYFNILRRRSCRAFWPSALTPEQMEPLLKAAFSAPYAAQHSRHYAVVQNRGVLLRLNQAAKEAAQFLQVPGLEQLAANPAYDCMYGAPAAIIISGSRHSVSPESDCAAAAENICLAAQALGLGGCWIYFPLLVFETDNAAKWLAELAIPEGYKPLAVVVVGDRQGAAAPPAERTEPVSYIR